MVCLGSGEGERDIDLSWDLLQHPWLAFLAIFGSYMDGHRTMDGTQHKTQNWRSPCRQGNTHQTGSKGHATPRNMQTERIPVDPKMPQPIGSDEAQWSEEAATEPQAGAAWAAPSAREPRMAERRWAPCRHPRGHGHRHQHRHRCTGFPMQYGPAFRETGAPGGNRRRKRLPLLKRHSSCS